MRDKEKSLNATGHALTLEKCLQEVEKYIAETSRATAERFLAQLEDAFASLCHDNGVAKAAIQLITERSSHIPTYTPVRSVSREAKRYKELLTEMTPEERQEFKLFDKALEENAARDYEKATVAVRELYDSLTQLLTPFTHQQFAHERDHYVGVGVWRILHSYHPNLRFRLCQDKVKQRHAR